ncbi:tetratricopeptide repeat protein [Solirubrobacter soli]|uniref:tetratricopeptide repeat protein n=1 Tax=Solirubrobacter soli TaxID=363832 RepID=UPI00041B32C7|nr:tetratricopeptide repeat protein [Solirubrobacter soli]
MTMTLEERETYVAARRLDAHERLINAQAFIASATVLAGELREAGRAEEALALAEESLTMCRRRFARRRRYWDMLPRCLEVVAEHRRAQGQRSAALQATQEAAAIRRKRGFSGRHRDQAFAVGSCLWDLTDDLRAVGRADDAVAAAREAIPAWACGAVELPNMRGAVGVSYDKLSRALGDAGQWPEALVASREAVAILSEEPPTADLADSLTQLATVLATLGQDDEARRAREQASAISQDEHSPSP